MPRKRTAIAGLKLPGTLSSTGWSLPKTLDQRRWIECGQMLSKIEGAVQWWLGDWWAFGEHAYGMRKALFEEGEPLENMNFGTVANYGWVARSVPTSLRNEVLSFDHHRHVAALKTELQDEWLELAVKGDGKKPWSSNELKAAIARQAALDRTAQVEFDAKALGKFAVLYADPPWQYENPPMGGSNRSIENHYPTMTIEELIALPVNEIAHENAVMFMWATSPKLAECIDLVRAWGFNYRTDMVWTKDKIGMGYHVREQHESLLIVKCGELPPPSVENRPSSVISAPRLEHSAKPPIVYDLIDRMYPNVRKLELFGRNCSGREWWTFWGNQAAQTDAA